MTSKMEKKYEIMQKVMDALEEILCSYPGRGHKSAYTDIDALVFLAQLVAGSQICVKKHSYDYDDEICNDETAVRIYRQLAPQTRWRTGCHTQIEQIRMNALKQLAAIGTPVYQGHIYYANTGSVLECGDILPYEIFQLFSNMPEVKKLYIFPYPFVDGREKPVYFSFEPSKAAVKEMKRYVEQKFDEMCRSINEKDGIINMIPEIDGTGI